MIVTKQLSEGRYKMSKKVIRKRWVNWGGNFLNNRDIIVTKGKEMGIEFITSAIVPLCMYLHFKIKGDPTVIKEREKWLEDNDHEVNNRMPQGAFPIG